jgi:pyruvate-formate lyase-activating enzyme
VDKFFPIKTETACQLKWTWSTVRLLSGDTSSCHRVNGTVISAENFKDFHNTEKQINDRKLMLEGKWPTGGCEYCRNIEDAGGVSDRLFQLKIPNLYPKELDDDINSVVVTPRIVEIYFDNVCNLSCVYCWDGFSTKIEHENNKFGRFEQDGIVVDNYVKKVDDLEQITAAFWEWLKTNNQDVKRLHVLGGEPLIQPQFDHCLEFFDKNPNKNLELNIVTNLMVPTNKLLRYINIVKKLLVDRKIKRFDITASIDCFGKEQEYVRHGLDLEQWKKNFKLLCNERWITLNINQTLTGLAIKTVPELIDYINSFNRPIGHFFSTPVFTHNCLHPKIFGKGFFDNDFKNIYNSMKTETWQQQQALEYMSGIHKEINAHERNSDEINRLKVFLDEMDRRRNLDWKQTFPWLTHVV